MRTIFFILKTTINIKKNFCEIFAEVLFDKLKFINAPTLFLRTRLIRFDEMTSINNDSFN